MISVENLTKCFGGQPLFESASFTINSRERVGLVGRNGAGKTTLLRLMVGDEWTSEGNIVIPKHYRIGYVRQNLEFEEDTVLKEGCRGLPEDMRDHDWEVEKILAGLGFSHDDMQRHPAEFSGGHQVRLNLAKVLASEPDLLLLDEPTNYLDITSIRWIERFLLGWPHEVILVTHDRSFMDKVVTHTLGIHRRKIRKIAGNTEKFYSQIAQDEEVYEKTRLNDDRRRKEVEVYISRFRAKARLASLVQSRIKTLAKQGKQEKLDAIESLDFSFRSKSYHGKYIMSVNDISFAYDSDVPLIRGLNIVIGAKDRIGVVGRNGKGKTTLLKLLSGGLAPQGGEVVASSAVEKGFFEQTNINSLVDTRTVLEEILYAGSDIDPQTARNICGAMMFEGDDALKKIAVISGGEKSRVMLGKVIVSPVNLLLLDEPTNHLDMESCDALLAAVDSFEGAVVMVTHNEMFLHAIAQRLIVFEGNKPYVFEGSYQEFLEKRGWEEEKSSPQFARKVVGKQSAKAKQSKKAMRRRRSEVIVLRGKTLKPIEERITLIENEIESHEKNIKVSNLALEEASHVQDGPKIVELSQSVHNSQTAIDKHFDELDKLTHSLNEKTALFDKELEELDALADS